MTTSNAKIPVTIVTGFLGSGKTTLMRKGSMSVRRTVPT